MIPRSNQCSLVRHLVFRDMIPISILSLRNLQLNNWDIFGDQRRYHCRKIVEIINHFVQNKSISIPLTSSTRLCLTPFKGVVLGWAFIPYCSLPELEACMEVWGFMEMIHSRSYTYIIKNVYSDPSEVFDKIITDERILERARSVTEAYDVHSGSPRVWHWQYVAGGLERFSIFCLD